MNISERFKRVKDIASMTDIVERYGNFSVKKGFICCPFHKEKTPSFKLYDKRYNCFGCGESGDIFNYVQKYCNLTNIEALEQLERDYGLYVEPTKKKSSKAQRLISNQYQIHRAEEKRIDAVYDDWEYEIKEVFYEFERLCLKYTNSPKHPNFCFALRYNAEATYYLDNMFSMEFEKFYAEVSGFINKIRAIVAKLKAGEELYG